MHSKFAIVILLILAFAFLGCEIPDSTNLITSVDNDWKSISNLTPPSMRSHPF